MSGAAQRFSAWLSGDNSAHPLSAKQQQSRNVALWAFGAVVLLSAYDGRWWEAAWASGLVVALVLLSSGRQKAGRAVLLLWAAANVVKVFVW